MSAHRSPTGSYYLTRNSLSYVAPTLLNDKAIGLTMTQIGGLTSILPVCYGGCPRPYSCTRLVAVCTRTHCWSMLTHEQWLEDRVSLQ